MKIIIFGATGAVGQEIAKAAIREKHEVTLFVRSRSKLEALLLPESLINCSVVEGDALDDAAVRDSMRGHCAAINAAGHVDDSQAFHRLFKGIVYAAAESLEPPKRLWMLAGVTALDVPSLQTESRALNDLPILYRTKYRIHTENYKVLLSDAAAGLDWSLLCPGDLGELEQWGIFKEACGIDEAPALIT